MAIFNENIKIIRERIFFYPDSDGNQEIKDEITILNLTDDPLFSIFLPKKDFMIGLKIFNQENKELVFYPNEFTKTYINEDISEGIPSSDNKHRTLLYKIQNHEIFLLWIKLPDGEEIQPNQSMILKLHYYSAKKEKFVNLSVSKMKFLFSIPRFRIRNNKMEGNTSDIFYIISAPKGYRINYAINKIVKIQNNKEIDISDSNKIYFDGDDKVVSIRTPGIHEEMSFDLIYDILPEKNEVVFYSIVFILLTGFSIFITLINIQFPLDFSTIEINDSFPFKEIITNIDKITGAMITITITVIGLLRQEFTNRTRLWLIIPIIILSVSFLAKTF